jgi:Phage integrase, N-terminal SAM-like domain
MTGSGLKETTAANYRRYIERNIVPSGLGAMKVTDIRRHHINALLRTSSRLGVVR